MEKIIKFKHNGKTKRLYFDTKECKAKGDSPEDDVYKIAIPDKDGGWEVHTIEKKNIIDIIDVKRPPKRRKSIGFI